MTDTPTDRETVEDLVDSLRSGWLVTDVVPDTMAALLDRAEKAEAEVERLREVARPFADAARDRAAEAPEWQNDDSVGIWVSIGDLRRILAALRDEGE